MANLKLIGADLSKYVWTGSEGDAAGFPAANLATYPEQEKWKSLTTAANQYVWTDMNADIKSRSGFAVIGHNWNGLTSGGVKVQAATNSAFTTGLVDLVNPLDCTRDPIVVPFSGATSNRYFRVLFMGTMATAPTAGVIMFDKLVDMGYPYDFPYRPSVRRYDTTEREMIDGLIRTSQARIGRRRWEFSMKATGGGFTDSVRSDWQTFYQTIRGKLRPFFFLDVDGTSAYYVHMESDDDPVEVFRYNINGIAQFNFREALAK